LKLCRPHQFVKNGFVFLPLFFAFRLFELLPFIQTALTFIAFSLTSAAVYIFNDIRDVEDDRKHPKKCKRPIAAGRVSIPEAYRLMLSVLGLGLFTAFAFVGIDVFIILLLYLVLNTAYSLKLKHKAIIDITCIATGFVFRVYSGAFAADVAVSQWIILMTFLLAIFLALAKRRDDLLLAESGKATRKSLDGYNFEFVSTAMAIMAAVSIVGYVMYTVSPEVVSRYGTANLSFTTFFVIIGFLRYFQITFVLERSGSPTMVLLKDLFLQIVITAWLLSFFIIIYALDH
jgi:4-hydroxybenzoate polyprenyltransferase